MTSPEKLACQLPCLPQRKPAASSTVLGPGLCPSQGTAVEAGTQTVFEDTVAEIGMETTTTVTAEEGAGGK